MTGPPELLLLAGSRGLVVEVVCPLLNQNDPWAVVSHCRQFTRCRPSLNVPRDGLIGLVGFRVGLVPRCSACGAVIGTRGHTRLR